MSSREIEKGFAPKEPIYMYNIQEPKRKKNATKALHRRFAAQFKKIGLCIYIKLVNKTPAKLILPEFLRKYKFNFFEKSNSNSKS